MFKEIVDDGRRTTDFGRSQKLTMCTLCSGELKKKKKTIHTLTLYQTRKYLDRCKLIAIADDKLNVIKQLKFVLGRVENILVKGENAGYQHFLLFPQCFLMAFFSRS